MRMMRRAGMYAPGGVKIVLDPVFANNTWETVIAACQQNIVPETWAVGNQKTMPINGADYNIDIIGKDHDTYADGSGTAPLTLQLHDIYAAKYKMNNSYTNAGGWADCLMRNTNLPAILALMPEEVQEGIREVNKLSSSGGSSGAAIKTTADKLFLLSEREVTGGRAQSLSGEGKQYEYYANGGSVIKSNTWWLRSAAVSSAANFLYVRTVGDITSQAASGSNYPCFAFCF